MKIGDKARLSHTAPLNLICTHGSASVLTITGIVAGTVFLQQDWTRENFIADESEIEVLASDDANIQALIYEARMDEIRNRRLKHNTSGEPA